MRFRERRVKRRADYALKIGAIDQDEHDELMQQAKGLGFLGIIDLIRMILDMIAEFLNRSPRDVEIMIASDQMPSAEEIQAAKTRWSH